MKQILYIDMDGVVCDLFKRVEQFEPNIKNLSEEEQSKVFDNVILNNKRIFKDLPLIEGAKESIEILSQYYDIYFLSTPVNELPESYMDKRIFIMNNFGSFYDKRLILSHRKDLNIGDYLIDDRLKNGSENFMGIHIHFGTSPFENWSKVLEYLMTVK